MSINRPLAPTAPRALHLPGGPHSIVLFHGLSSSPLELQFVARGLQRAGYTVRVPVIQGYTYGLLGAGPHTVEAWVDTALHEVDTLLASGHTVSIGGLCLGAVLALRVAALRQGQLANVLALSTALHYDGWGNPWFTPLLPLARVVPFAPRIHIKERSPFGLKDERMRAWIERQMRQAGDSDAGASALRVADLLKARELIALTRRALPRINTPTLLIHAKEDECATPRSSYEVASRVQANRVRCVLLHDSYHMISIDREKEQVLSEMLQFLAQTEEPAQPATLAERPNVLSFHEHRKGSGT